MIGKDELTLMFRGAAARIRDQHRRLSELDCIAGDGDHGSTMLRVVEQLECASGATPAELLRDAGWRILGVDGGASSSLLGTFFSGMAEDCGDLAAACESGLAAVRRQTRAQPGDKTMMDALVPAVRELRAGSGLRGAAEAARAGADSTRGLVARHGRAKYLGEKTRGHEDPGAESIALLFEGFYRGLAGQETNMLKKDTTQVVCVAEFRAKEGRTDDLIAALHVLMGPTHKEPGCIRYELNQREDDPRWITFIEKWKDRKTFDKHCAMPYITDYFDNVRPGLVENFEVKLYHEILP